MFLNNFRITVLCTDDWIKLEKLSLLNIWVLFNSYLMASLSIIKCYCSNTKDLLPFRNQSISLLLFFSIFIIIYNANYCLLTYRSCTKKNKKQNSEQWKLEQTSNTHIYIIYMVYTWLNRVSIHTKKYSLYSKENSTKNM